MEKLSGKKAEGVTWIDGETEGDRNEGEVNIQTMRERGSKGNKRDSLF